MLSDASSAMPAIPEPAGFGPRLWSAVVTSLLLHAGLAVALSRGGPAPAPRDDNKAASFVTVNVATSGTQRKKASPASATTTESNAGIAQSSSVPLTVDPPAPTGTEPFPASNAPPSNSNVDNGGETAPDIETLQNSVARYLINYTSELLEQGLPGCLPYPDSHERWDCPEEAEVKSATQALIDEDTEDMFRAWVSGRNSNARISRTLLSDMETLRPLMADEGVLGTVARERYYVKALQYRYLTPDAKTGGTIRLLTFTGSGIVVLDGRLRIGWDGEIRRGELAKGPARHFDAEED
jgi:hypothetical protein